jgi:phosphatidylglycerol---prolipoprotein diacylglyceryl transferase
MLPKIISFGDFFIPTYGLLVAGGFLLSLWLAGKLAARDGLNSEKILNLGIYAALAGLAGAKLAMIFFDFGYYTDHPDEIVSLSFLRAGGVFQGGLILALIVAFWYMRRVKLPPLRTCDVFAPALALGHGLGRIGCFAAGCCWGQRTNVPWAVTFHNPDAQKLVGTPLNVALHPTQLYEAFAEFALFGILLWYVRGPHREGGPIGLYLVLYSIVRFIVEFFRFHEQALPFGLPFSITQWISLALLATGVVLMLRGRRSGAPSPAVPSRA